MNSKCFRLTYIVLSETAHEDISVTYEDPIKFKHFDHDYDWNTIQKFGIGLIKLLDHNGVSRQVQRDVVKHINDNLLSAFDPVAVTGKRCIYLQTFYNANQNLDLGGLVASPEAIHRLLNKGSINTVQMYDVCRDGCYLFDDNVDQLHCINPSCGKGRYKDQKKAEALIHAGSNTPQEAFQTMAISSVGASLAELLVDDEIREDMEYSRQFSQYDEEGVYIDMFSGSVYKDFLQRNLLTRNDVCLVLYVDGFPNKSKPGSSQTLVHCIVMNIPASKRYTYLAALRKYLLC